MASVTTAAIKKSISAILKDADLNTLSAKKVRKMLETEYKTDLTTRKSEIDELVMSMIKESTSKNEKESENESQSEEEDPPSEEEEPKKKRKRSNNIRKAKSEDDDSDEEGKSSKKKKKKEPVEKKKRDSTYKRKCALSPELAAVVGDNEMARSEVVKRMWAVVRERNLFDPKNKQFAICDEQLFKVFGTKRVRMFGMMKHLKSHIKDQK